MEQKQLQTIVIPSDKILSAVDWDIRIAVYAEVHDASELRLNYEFLMLKADEDVPNNFSDYKFLNTIKLQSNCGLEIKICHIYYRKWLT